MASNPSFTILGIHDIQLQRIASHHITSHHITSHHITSHHIISELTTLRQITSHNITHVTLRYISSNYVTSHHIASPRITSHHLTLLYWSSLHFFPLLRLNSKCKMAQRQSSFPPQELLNLIDTTWRQFSETSVPLTSNQQNNIRRCSRLVATDPSTIHRNAPKSRAHRILNDILRCSEELFFLCALSACPTQLGKLKSEDYLRGLVDWRKDKTCPKGLRYAITHYYALLPRKKATGERPKVTPSRLKPY